MYFKFNNMTSRQSLELIVQNFIYQLNAHSQSHPVDKPKIDEAINPVLVKFGLDHLKPTLFKNTQASQPQQSNANQTGTSIQNTPDLWEKKTTPVIKHVSPADSVVETISKEEIPVEKELFSTYQNKFEGNKEKFPDTNSLLEYMKANGLNVEKWNSDSKLERVYADFEKQIQKKLGL